MRPALLLLLLAAAAFLPFLDFPEWRGTEARRVQIAVEMVETGDYVVPRLWEEPTFAKPPFYYWVLAGSFHVFGVSTWSARLPSALAFFLLALLAFHCLRRWHDEATAWLGAACVLCSPVVLHDVPFAEIDPLFAVLSTAAVVLLADGVSAGRVWTIALAGVLGGLAVMTKGPPFLMFCLLPLVAWWRRSRCRGIVPFLVLVVAFYGIYKLVLDGRVPPAAADHAGDVAVQETMGRLAFWRPQSLLGIPKHIATSALVIGAPFSLWWVAWWRRRGESKGRSDFRTDFLLLGAISGAFVLLFSTDRSTRYLLPAVPMVAIGMAPLVTRTWREFSPPPVGVRRACAALGMLAGAAMIAWPFLPHPYPGRTWFALLVVGLIGSVLDSRSRLVEFAVIVPVLIAWGAFPDRQAYARTALDFTPVRAAVIAREFQRRGIHAIETDGHVGTSILLATKEALGGRLRIRGDYEQRRAAGARHVVVVDRGRGDLDPRAAGDVAAYRDVLRVQISRSKSFSVRERR